jgi:hypothetical protein
MLENHYIRQNKDSTRNLGYPMINANARRYAVIMQMLKKQQKNCWINLNLRKMVSLICGMHRMRDGME